MQIPIRSLWPVTSRRALSVAIALTLGPPAALAQRAVDPAAATVLIRVTGDVRVEIDEFGATRTLDRRGVQIGVGSGFVISPFGYVVTAHHVIGRQEINAQRAGVTIRARAEPTRFEVVFSTSAGATTTVPPFPVTASVVASDPASDVALLYVTGAFPYLALGDSAAVERSAQVQAIGYPFGDRIDVLLGNASSGRAPEITASKGTVTALRFDASRELQLIQTDSTINPGNSGGPLVDEDGYAVGVVVSEIQQGSRSTGLGFAVPINTVKRLIEAHGLDQSLPSRRLRLGAVQELPPKGMRAAVLDGRADVSPARVRVDLGDMEGEVTFRADRVYTPWSVQELERWLLNETALEPALAIQRPRQSVFEASGRLRGRATARHRTSGEPFEMVYAIIDLGEEKVIARFVGLAEQVAFNRSVLDAALSAFDADALLSGGPLDVSSITWTTGAFLGSDAPGISLPAGWLLERSSGVVCSERLPPAQLLWVVPAGDFTLALRIAWWPQGITDATRVAAACGGGLMGEAPFAQRTTWVGVPYVTEGIVRAIDTGGVLQLAVIAPAARLTSARGMFQEWVGKAVP